MRKENGIEAINSFFFKNWMKDQTIYTNAMNYVIMAKNLHNESFCSDTLL